jgi:hypothetical protein
MFYVYEWYIVDTGEIIYVGKGIRNRYKVRKHNKFFNEMIKRYKCDSRIIKEYATEKEAFSYEFDRISELKKIGQCVCNIYNGGAGGTVGWWTPDKKEWYAEHNAMKSEKQRKRMSKENPMKNKDVAEMVNSQKRIPIIIGNKRYNSIKSACDALCTSAPTINGWILRGTTTSGEICKYDDGIEHKSYVFKNNGQKKEVIYKGKRYESATAMSNEIGVTQTTASRWCRQGRDSFGNECRYSEDPRIGNDCCIKQEHIPVIVNGVFYPSKESASRSLNISVYLLTQYLDKKKHNENYNCEYGNQQPSRENTDNSIPEGSTTNR